VSVMLIVAAAMVSLPLVRQYENAEAGYNNRPSVILAVLLACLIPVSALFIYAKWGDLKGLHEWFALKNQPKINTKMFAKLNTPQKVIDKLKQHLQVAPKSTKGWFLLGRLYFSLGQFANATNAMEHAHNLEKNNPYIAVQYAQALYFSHGRSLKGKAQQLVNQVLATDKKNQ